jgi:flavin reductase (DIM6/NTAB) family NADH-FMN oxidoreductase RutF
VDDEQVYGLLRNLTSPIVAVTSHRNDESNGMIANSAVRASLVPEIPRLSFYCFKRHHSHELIEETEKFCFHLLHRDQFMVVRHLGFDSGREHDKLSRIDWRKNDMDLPVIENAYAWMSCRVINSMDAGPSTFFLGEVETCQLHEQADDLQVLDSEYFRANMPEDWVSLYRENKRDVQKWAREHADVST